MILATQRPEEQAHDGGLARALVCFALMLAVVLLPPMALADNGQGRSIEAVLCDILQDITGQTGYAFAVVVITGIGIAALLGKVNWVLALTVTVAIALIFGAGTVITAMGGNGNACNDITVVFNPGTYTGQNALDFCNTHPEDDGTPGGFYPNATTDANGNLQLGAPNNAIARPLVECFTDPVQGIIPSFALAFLNSTQPYFVPFVGIMATLGVSFFGLKLMAGDIQRLQAESFILLFKIAGVFYFLTSAPDIYSQLLSILTGLSDVISGAAASLDPNGFCNTSTGADGLPDANDLWQRWDCILGKLFNFSANQAPLVSIGAFLVQLFFNSGSGVSIAFLGVYVILALVFALIRFLYVYIMAVLAFSFLFIFGYLFVPMILFKDTQKYFEKWTQIILAYILMPVILLGYMGMMLVLFDTVFYSGPNSVWNMADPVDAGAADPGNNNNVFANVTQNQTQDQMFGLLYPDYGNIGVAQQDNNLQNVNAGVAAANMRDLNITATDFQANPAATAPAAGVETKTLNTTALGGTGYLSNLETSFASAGLLIYVMYSLISYIPKMAAGLVAQGTSAGMIASAKIFGEGFSFNMAGMAQKMAGGASSGLAGAMRGAVSGMVTKR